MALVAPDRLPNYQWRRRGTFEFPFRALDLGPAFGWVVLARRKHPGGHNTLDDLCSRYGVDRSRRTQHGALLDAELLAAVYVELTTTRQTALQLEPIALATSNIQAIVRARPHLLPPRVTADDRNAHWAFVQTLGSDAPRKNGIRDSWLLSVWDHLGA